MALHFKECLKLGKNLEILIRMPKFADAPLPNIQGFDDECQRSLAWAYEVVGNPPGDIAGIGAVKIAVDERGQSDDDSSSRTLGQVTDAAGNSLEFAADWGVELAGADEKWPLEVGWSWGDPSFRVAKSIQATERLWNSPDSSLTRTASTSLTAALKAALDQLIQSPLSAKQAVPSRQLFSHQRDAVEKWMAQNCRGIFKMCTGAGKTIAALAGVQELSKLTRGKGDKLPVIVTVPTRVLADQWITEINRFGFLPALGAYNSFGQWGDLLEPYLHDTGPRFIVTTYCTFADPRFVDRLKRAARAGVGALWIADEMHNLSSMRLRDAMQEVGGLFRYRLGLSATPDIEENFSASEYLREFFGAICKSYDLPDGIRDRVLCRYRYYPQPAYLEPKLGGQYLDLLDQLHGREIDQTKRMELYRLTRQLLRTSGVQLSYFAALLDQLCKAGPDVSHTLVYCPPGYGAYGFDRADEIGKEFYDSRLVEGVVDILRNRGLSTSSILGGTPGPQRLEILKRFARGELQTLCAIGCLDEGVDVPSIKRAIVLYSVDREKQFVQRRGRILRNPARDDKKIAEIYDVVLLPHGTDMSSEKAELLLSKELRRYRTFAELAMNREEADQVLANALATASRHR